MRIIVGTALLALMACSGERQNDNTDANVSAETAVCPPGVSVVDAWTRPARAGQPVSAAYVTLCNGGDADALVGISSVGGPAASAIEMHLSAMSDGVMSMKQVERIDLPANARTTFEPGGAHIMLIGVEREIAAGAAPTFKLEFENAEPIHWAFKVRSEDDADDGHSHH